MGLQRIDSRSRVRGQAGFTLMEILVTLVVFSISIVGLVAIQSRSVEAEKAANQIRGAERLASEVMAELMSTGFDELVNFDFEDKQPDPAVGYSDYGIDATNRLRDYRRPPADQLESLTYIGSLRNTYIVSRRVSFVCAQDLTNPCVAGDPSSVMALNFEVRVQWIDDTNPTYPPPASLKLTTVTPEMSEPTHTDYEPFIGHVELYTTRFNDGLP